MMYKQTLCVTLPISAAVIIAAALFANAGDINPPEGPIGPTMHDLQEIYDLVQQSSPCGGCTWEYKYLAISLTVPRVQVVAGPGILHGFYIKGSNVGNFDGGVLVSDGPLEGGNIIGNFGTRLGSSPDQPRNIFFELNVPFENGLYFDAIDNNVLVTVLYRSTTP